MLLHKNVLQIFNNKKCKKNSCQGLRDVCRWIPIPCPQQPLHEPLGSSGLCHIDIHPNVIWLSYSKRNLFRKGRRDHDGGRCSTCSTTDSSRFKQLFFDLIAKSRLLARHFGRPQQKSGSMQSHCKSVQDHIRPSMLYVIYQWEGDNVY